MPSRNVSNLKGPKRKYYINTKQSIHIDHERIESHFFFVGSRKNIGFLEIKPKSMENNTDWRQDYNPPKKNPINEAQGERPLVMLDDAKKKLN